MFSRYSVLKEATTVEFHLYISKYRWLGVYSMNKAGAWRKMFITGANAASRGRAGAQHLLGNFSSPCFGVITVFNYRHRVPSHTHVLPTIQTISSRYAMSTALVERPTVCKCIVI
jgi:hypothetical protein